MASSHSEFRSFSCRSAQETNHFWIHTLREFFLLLFLTVTFRYVLTDDLISLSLLDLSL